MCRCQQQRQRKIFISQTLTEFWENILKRNSQNFLRSSYAYPKPLLQKNILKVDDLIYGKAQLTTERS
jgi:hypothetical protein